MLRQWFRAFLIKDDQLSHRLRLTPRKGLLWWPAAFLAHSGDSWFWMIGLGLIWLFGPPDWHGRSATLAVGIVFQALIVFALKFTIRRARPAGEWGAIYRTTDPHSFPSGHATRAFFLLALASGLGPTWLFIALLLWAPLVSLARVMTGVHYLSDVLAGAVLGLFFGWLVFLAQPLIVTSFPYLYWPFSLSWFISL